MGQFVFFAVLFNGMIVALLALAHAGETGGLNWKAGLRHAYFREGTPHEFFSTYIAFMAVVIGTLVAVHLATFFAARRNRERGAIEELDLPVFRMVGLVSILVAAIVTPYTVAAVAKNITYGSRYWEVVVVLGLTPVVLAIAVGRFVVYSDRERLAGMAKFQRLDGKLKVALEEQQTSERQLSVAGVFLAVMVVIIGVGASLTLSAGLSTIEQAFGISYVLLFAALMPYLGQLSEKDALSATTRSEQIVMRSAYWVVGATFHVLLMMIFFVSQPNARQWFGVLLVWVGFLLPISARLVPLVEGWWSVYPSVFAYRSVEKRMAVRENEIIKLKQTQRKVSYSTRGLVLRPQSRLTAAPRRSENLVRHDINRRGSVG